MDLKRKTTEQKRPVPEPLEVFGINWETNYLVMKRVTCKIVWWFKETTDKTGPRRPTPEMLASGAHWAGNLGSQ